jgi:hydroxypyruvate isomerase
MTFSLRYAPHLGFSPPDQLLFGELAGDDRAENVRFAPREGMAGVLYPWAIDSPVDERRAVAEALRETGLACGFIVSTPRSELMNPIWVTEGGAASKALLGHIANAVRVAKEIGSPMLAVLIRGDGVSEPDVQRQRAIENLRAAADLASADGLMLGIEPMIKLPDMLLRTFDEGVAMVDEAAHPAIKLVFDVAHVTSMGDPLLETYVNSYDDIAVLQLGDMPGRVEVGAGEIDFVPLLAHAIHRGYAGLVDLEHYWSNPGPACERRGLEMLAEIDAAAARHAAAENSVQLDL